MSNTATTLLATIWALTNLIITSSGSESLRPVLSGPTMAYPSNRVAFSGTDLQGDQPASFFLKVAMTSGGSYQCRAQADDREGSSNSVHLTVVIPPSETRITSEPFPPVAYEGSRLVLHCNVSRGSHLSYSWFFNRRELSPASPLYRTRGESLVMERVQPEHAGQYSCMAWSSVLDMKRYSSSTAVQLTVKELVTQPQLSFSVSKDAAGGFVGNVSCSVSRGTPPINFTFLLERREEAAVTVMSRSASFLFPVVQRLEMGSARCRAQTQVQDVLSDSFPLEVVPVGGRLEVQMDYFYTADHKATAAKLSCQINQGTFPIVEWLHNSSVLTVKPTEFHIPHLAPPFVFTDRGRKLILAKLGPDVFGYYRCRARDSYDDNSTWAESDDVLVQIKGSLSFTPKPLPAPPTTALNVSTPIIESISIVFCCFVLLALVVAVACVSKMIDKRRDTEVRRRRSFFERALSARPSISRSVRENTHTQMTDV
ncbi:unnamed protein product [Knipowitschia caucasica]|uniref:Ig-like domain-containing protein n=1 Tax=Knipowitschia caucasica TaxID=637954 RepID=A0AAV2LK28_KNICA